MPTHTTLKKPKRSLAALRKKQEERLLKMSDEEFEKEMLGTLSRVADIIRKRS